MVNRKEQPNLAASTAAATPSENQCRIGRTRHDIRSTAKMAERMNVSRDMV